MSRKVLLIGCGEMAVAYWKVLDALQMSVTVVGRGSASAKRFTESTGHNVVFAPPEEIIAKERFDSVICAVSVDSLSEVTQVVLNAGAKRVLVEKPACLSSTEIEGLWRLSVQKNASVFVAYNRRFYESIRLAKEIMARDGGPTSAHFDFTEWSHQISDAGFSQKVKNRWFLANSSHIVDLVFHLIGRPRELLSMTTGSLTWHPEGREFVGHGVSEKGVLFSYHANWGGPGRWLCEFVTTHHKLVLQPLEKLRIVKVGDINVYDVPGSNDLDAKFKPGIYRQVKAFLDDDDADLCSLKEHLESWKHYQRIAGYCS